MVLRNDEDTYASYPFMFMLEVKYAIKHNTLTCTYTVHNTDIKTIYFSVGGHPAFNLPISNDLDYSDYFLKFNADTTLERYLLNNGLITNETETIELDDGILPLHPSLFYNMMQLF